MRLSLKVLVMDNVAVSFRNDNAHFTLQYPDALKQLPIKNLRKLFQLMLSDWHTEENADAIRFTHEALEALVAETKEAWGAASLEFQRGYVDTKYHAVNNKKRAEANNRKLAAAVKSAKAAHERAKKLLTSYEETKAKYQN